MTIIISFATLVSDFFQKHMAGYCGLLKTANEIEWDNIKKQGEINKNVNNYFVRQKKATEEGFNSVEEYERYLQEEEYFNRIDSVREFFDYLQEDYN